MITKNDRIGPPSVSIAQMVLKTFAGAVSGVAGTLVLIAVFLLASSILQPVLSPSLDEVIPTHPLFIFIFMVMIFMASMVSSLCGAVFISMTDREKYSELASSLYQTFIVNFVILILTLPFYLLAPKLGIETAGYVAGLHIVISSIATCLILEILGDHEYALLGVYSIILAILVSVGMCFLFYFMGGGSPLLLLFIAFPLVWTSLGLFNGLVGFLYHLIFTTYGVDFLSAETKYGSDYGVAHPEPSPIGQDVSGSEFMKKG